MKNIALIILILAVAGCSTMQPPRYSVSADNVQILRELEDYKIKVSSIGQSANYNSGCRLVGPIEPADSLSMGEFIAKAFNDEFKIANIYSDNGSALSGDITKVSFSSSDNLTSGNWDIALTLNSFNGNTLSIQNKYRFKSGFDALTACNATADALSSAVQDLIKITITDPKFKSLL